MDFPRTRRVMHMILMCMYVEHFIYGYSCSLTLVLLLFKNLVLTSTDSPLPLSQWSICVPSSQPIYFVIFLMCWSIGND